MDKLQAMTTFVRIVDKGSLTAAADALGTSLPSVVRTLAGLEKEVGVRLLNRTTRRIHLTDEGAQYLDRCRAILQAVGEADALLSASRPEPQGRLAVTASSLFGRRYVVPVVSDFIRRFPGISVELMLLDRVVGLVEEGMDVGIRIGHLADSSLIAIPVGKTRRVTCASPAYLRESGLPKSPEDLRQHRCVRFESIAASQDWTYLRGRKKVPVRVANVVSTNQVDAAVDFCVKGLGIGMFLSYQVAAQVAQGSLRYVLAAVEPEPLPVHVVYPHSRLQSPRVRKFVDACVAQLRAITFE